MGCKAAGYNEYQGVDCVKYNPHDDTKIASSYKNGNVSIWDIRH